MHLRAENGTEDYTAMHWHGLRIANAMDGVPYLTQMPIAGGESFDYTFPLRMPAPFGITRTA